MTFPAMPLYRLVVCLAWPIVALSLLTRVIARRERLADWGQRTGLAPGRGSGPHLWLHAASNGELLLSLFPVIGFVCHNFSDK